MATITATLENMEQEMQKKNTEVHQARELVFRYKMMLYYLIICSQIGALKREEEDLQR